MQLRLRNFKLFLAKKFRSTLGFGNTQYGTVPSEVYNFHAGAMSLDLKFWSDSSFTRNRVVQLQ